MIDRRGKEREDPPYFTSPLIKDRVGFMGR